MSDLNVKVGAVLDESAKANIQSEINNIKGLQIKNIDVDTSKIKQSIESAIRDAFSGSSLNSIKMPKITASGSGIGNITSQYKTEFQQLSKMAREMGSLKFKIAGLDVSQNKSELTTLTNQLKEFERSYKTLLSGIGGNLSTDQWGKLQAIIDSTDDKIQSFKSKTLDNIKFSLDTEGYSTEIAQLTNSLSKFDSVSGSTFNKAKQSVDSLKATYKEMQSMFNDSSGKYTDDDRIAAEQRYQQALVKTKNLLNQLNFDKDNQVVHVGDEKRVNMINTLNNYLAKNTAMTRESRQEIEKWIATLSSSDDMTVGSIKNINTQFKTLDSTLRQNGQLGLSWGDKLKQTWEKFGGWSIATATMTKTAQQVREAVTEIKELDSILTEINKVADMTDKELAQLGDSAFDTASRYGKKASDYLVGIQEMYRAGFDNANEMAELSVLAQAAGDLESTAANDYLMATNAAYKYKGSVEQLNKVLDSQNYITNNAAVSMKDMADATSQTATVAAQYGVQADELSALIGTATANTRKSGSEIGTALKAILINLQDTTSEPVTETFDALGISMTKFVNGAEVLKTPIELIYELADAYNSLPEGDVMRANILNEIGQKRHANVLASILSDMESYEKMLKLYHSDSAQGSALREADKSANNLEGSLNRLSNTWTDTVDNIASSDTLKGAVNGLNGLLQLVNGLTDKLGGLGSLGLFGGLIAGLKNVGRPKVYGLM